MIEGLFTGVVTLKIDGFDTSLLNEKLYRTCKVISLYTKSDSVFLTTAGLYEKKVRSLCEKSNCICEAVERRGAIYTVSKYFKRCGMYIGAIAVMIGIIFLSNVVMKIEINGTDNEMLIYEIRAMLKENGLYAGAYIPSQNFLELSNKLFASVDGVSWASIGSSGSVVYVNISETTPKVKSESKRIPCNITASRDAIITNAEVMVGRLDVLLGDAVYQGQILVSGVIEHESGVTKYYHSYARITGRYEDSIEFSQKYIEESIIDCEKVYRKCIGFFELEIPLPGTKLENGANYSQKSQSVPVKLFGITLPFSVINYEYTELKSDIKTYSTAEAIQSVYKKLENYEKNFLKDVIIIERNVTETQSDDGVSLSVNYVLEGEIGKISEIYIK